MKIIFEGTEEQISNLKALVGPKSSDLPTIREYYQKENLWQIEDVQLNYECTDSEAMNILESALTNEATMDQIWFAIDYHAENKGLTKINKD